LMKQAHFINFRYNFEQETKHELVESRINWRGEFDYCQAKLV